MSAELATLNPHHQRRMRATFQYIDNLLSEIDAILKPRDSGSLFPRYAIDFAPSQRVLLRSGIAEIRGRLVQAMQDYKVDVGPPTISAVQAVRSALSFIDIAVTELRPRYMRGYGAVPPEAAAQLERTVDQLDQLVHQVDALMSRSQDIASRYAMTESADPIVSEAAAGDIPTALVRLSAIAAELGADRAASEATRPGRPRRRGPLLRCLLRAI